MYVEAHVIPGAKKEMLVSEGETAFRISVSEPARHNLANRRVAELLAGHFNVIPQAVRLISGHRSPKKIFTIDK